jgi:hypothetical protein
MGLFYSSDSMQVYISEVFEDVVEVTPSLVAVIKCPSDFDCMIRISVYYSSSLTDDKEVLLAGTSFTRSELVRSMHVKGVFISDMISEHCPGSKAYIEIMKSLPMALPDLPRQICTEIAQPVGFNVTGLENQNNPFRQRYVFYNPENNFLPLVDAEEVTWEPQFAALIPALFMENFASALMRSITAWSLRYELERKRQGRFRSLSEAHQHGWHQVSIVVHAARIGDSRARRERLREKQRQQDLAVQAALAYELQQQQQLEVGFNAGEGGSRRSKRFSANPTQSGGGNSSNNRPTSVAAGGSSMGASGSIVGAAGRSSSSEAGGGGGSRDKEPVLPVYHVCIPLDTTIELNTNQNSDALAQSLNIQVLDPNFAASGGHNTLSAIPPGPGGSKSGGAKRVQLDDTAPSTFVDISIEDKYVKISKINYCYC